MGLFPIKVTPDGTGIWIGSNDGTDRVRIVRVDAINGEQTHIDSDPTHDIDPRARVYRESRSPPDPRPAQP